MTQPTSERTASDASVQFRAGLLAHAAAEPFDAGKPPAWQDGFLAGQSFKGGGSVRKRDTGRSG